ncbi:MAG: phosphoribosylglycinamide synthetase C domain-containing protein, partial [Acidimicrobiia bacterium]
GEELPQLAFSDVACVTVVMATEGYPVSPYRTGDAIQGIDRAEALEGVIVFHAGSASDGDGGFIAAGGRVLDVTAIGPSIAEARARAYEAAALITWRGVQYRHDIAANPT